MKNRGTKQQGMKQQGAIVGAIVITLLFGALFLFYLYRMHGSMQEVPDSSYLGFTEKKWVYTGNWITDIGLAIGYTLIHPVLGRITASVIWWLCKGIDLLYELDEGDRWSNWSSDRKLWTGVLWPITGAFMLPITLVGLVYGWLYKSFFRAD